MKIKTISGTPRQKVEIINQVFPKKLIKFYPYEIINQDKSKTLLEANATSIIYVSQKNFDNLKKYHKFKKDENDQYYFVVLAVQDVDYELTIVNDLDSFSNKITTISSFKALTNEFFDYSKFEGMVFSAKKPFAFNLTTSKQDEMYTIENVKQADRYNWEEHFQKEEMLVEFTATSFKNHLNQFDNAKVLFVDRDIQKEIIFQLPNYSPNEDILKKYPDIVDKIVEKDGSPISKLFFGFNFFSLINDFKVFCNYTITNLNKTFEGYMHIKTSIFKNEEQNCKMLPIKMSAINNNDQLLMFADWFDYDIALPFFVAKAFQNGNNFNLKFTNENEEVKLFPSIDDKKLILDLISITAAFQDNFNKFPRITDENNVNFGKIPLKYKIGFSKILVLDLVGKDCKVICDGMIQSHFSKFPSFEKNQKRAFIFNGMIAALSKYINCSRSIASGNNKFNEALLPWYLDLFLSGTNKIDYFNEYDKLETYGVKESVEFITKSFYFKKDYFDSTTSDNSLSLPIENNLSKEKIIQTDRKIALPKIKDVIDIIEKQTNPADIETNDEALKYIWFMPFVSNKTFTKIFANTIQVEEFKKDKLVKVQLEDTDYGNILTDQEIKQKILKIQPGVIQNNANVQIVQSNIQNITVLTNFKILNPNSNQVFELDNTFFLEEKLKSYPFGSEKLFRGPNTFTFSKVLPMENLKEDISRILNMPKETINIIANNISIKSQWLIYKDRDGSKIYRTFKKMFATGNFQFSINKQTFSEATVLSSGISFEYYFSERNVENTRDSWYKFLANKSINAEKHIVSGFEELIEFEPIEKKYKINQIKEIIIKQIWGDTFKIFLYQQPTIKDLEDFYNDSNDTASITFETFLAWFKEKLKQENKNFLELIEIPLINKNDEEIVLQKVLFI